MSKVLCSPNLLFNHSNLLRTFIPMFNQSDLLNPGKKQEENKIKVTPHMNLNT